MAARRASVSWQEGIVAVLAIALALTGAVTVLVRNSETHNNSTDLAKAVQGLSSLTTVSSAPEQTSTSIAPFVAQDAGFSAVFPTTPKRQEQPVNTAGVSLTAIIYISTTADEVVGAGSATMAFTPTGSALQSGLDGAINGTAKNVNGTVASRAMTTYLGVPAEDGVVEVAGSASIHERVLFRQRKILVLLGITQTADTPHPDYDRLLATFQPL